MIRTQTDYIATYNDLFEEALVSPGASSRATNQDPIMFVFLLRPGSCVIC